MIDKLLAVILENKREGEERWGGRRGMVKNTVRQQRQNRKQSKQHQQENPMVAFMYGIKSPETKRQYPRDLRCSLTSWTWVQIYH